MSTPPLQLLLVRNTHLFSNRPGAVKQVEPLRTSLLLVPDQLLHPPEPGDFIVRRGKLRVSHFLPDGREVTRSVLQSGSVFSVRAVDENPEGGPAANPVEDVEADRYPLADIVMMALNEGELWVLPPDTLNQVLQITLQNSLQDEERSK